VVDQRISMWTGLLGPAAAILNLFWGDPGFTLIYIAWISLTRLLLSVPLFMYAQRIRPAFPVFLYVNQLANSLIKGYLVFRPATQRWLNRGNQHARAVPSRIGRFRERMANYIMVVWVVAMAVGMATYIGIMRRPTLEAVWRVMHGG
jgi:hypothetical protein